MPDRVPPSRTPEIPPAGGAEAPSPLPPLMDLEQVPEAGRKGGAAYYHPGYAPAVQPIVLDWPLAAIAGVLAGLLALLYYLLVPPLLSQPAVDLGRLLGSFLFAMGERDAAIIGTVWLLVNGIILTLLYAGVLGASRRQSTPATGLRFGFTLFLITTLGYALLAAAQPRVQAALLSDPGLPVRWLVENWPVGLMHLGAHLLFGFTAGAIYRHHLERARRPAALR